MTLYTTIDRCRSCGSAELAEALDLGLFSLSDFKDSPDDHTDKAPLVLLRCEECTLVQLRHTVARERLYANYWYRSATQPAMVAALQDVVRDAQSRVSLQRGDVVVDVGANDGTLLAQYPDGIRRLAYEPALNLWADLANSGASIVGGFFPPKGQPAYRKAKVITSVACFYDVDDPNAFVKGIKANLADDGVWINQMAYLPATLASNNFGDIVHEHLTFWTGQSFAALLKRHDLHIADVSLNDVNGGSVRFVVRHEHAFHAARDGVGLFSLKAFERRIQLQRSEIRDFLQACKRDGHSVVGYGASTKGATYLQYWDVGHDLLPTIADRNPAKWEKYTPTGQLVISEEEMRNHPPDFLLALPFHFIDAFVEREADLLAQGTQFVVPFPTLTVIGGDVSLSLAEQDSVKALAS